MTKNFPPCPTSGRGREDASVSGRLVVPAALGRIDGNLNLLLVGRCVERDGYGVHKSLLAKLAHKQPSYCIDNQR